MSYLIVNTIDFRNPQDPEKDAALPKAGMCSSYRSGEESLLGFGTDILTKPQWKILSVPELDEREAKTYCMEMPASPGGYAQFRSMRIDLTGLDAKFTVLSLEDLHRRTSLVPLFEDEHIVG